LAALKARALGLLGLALLTLTLTTPYLLGALGAYLQMLCAALCLGALLLDRQFPALKGDPAFKFLLVAFAIVVIVFVPTAKRPGDAAYSLNFVMLLGFGPVSRFLAGFGAPGNVRRLANFALAGAAAALAFALYLTVVAHYDRAPGWETDPIWSAEAAMILGFLAGLGVAIPGRWRAVYLIGPLFGVITCLLSGSRGPLLAIPVLVAILVAVSSRHRWLLLAAIVAGGALAVLALDCLWPAPLDRAMSIFTIARGVASGGGAGEVSAGTRLAFYQAGFAAFLHSPWIGYGWAGKMQAVVPYLPGDGAALVAPHLHLHSDILDFGVAGGIPGLIAYALIIIGPLLGALRGPHDTQYSARLAAALIIATGYFVCGLTYLMFGYEFHTELYVCLAAVIVGYCRDEPIRPLVPATQQP